MKLGVTGFLLAKETSPLAEGRELKLPRGYQFREATKSPLAEGRELKYLLCAVSAFLVGSPLAEGRELK